MTRTRNVIVIGGGVAGLSCAAFASAQPGLSVTVLEAESQPGYHSSGRSAAVYIEPYMNATVFGLTRASLEFFRNPPTAFRTGSVLSARESLMIASAECAERIDPYLSSWADLCPQLQEVSSSEALRRVPILRPEAVVRAVEDPRAMAMDVHGLLDGYRRLLESNGGALCTGRRVNDIERRAGLWHVSATGHEVLSADVLVNAAGAWGDEVADLAGVERLGLRPLRRTALLIDTEGNDASRWPLVHAADGTFYLKPESDQLMLSPVDESPSLPCDAQPEDLDVALAIDHLQRATTLSVPRVAHKWAGLRTFLADDIPAVGFDAAADQFFWLTGQGGFGMQTSAAMGRLSAALLAGTSLPAELSEWGVVARVLSPERLRA